MPVQYLAQTHWILGEVSTPGHCGARQGLSGSLAAGKVQHYGLRMITNKRIAAF
jgi:hypothetical protein